LDVLEYEKKSLSKMFSESGLPEAFLPYLINAENVLLTPQCSWNGRVESKIKLAQNCGR